MGTLGNIKIEPCNVTWGTDTVQVETVTTRADSSGNLNNDYFFFYHTNGTKYHAWFNVNSAGVDPAPGGSTAVEVAVATNASAGTVATALAAAIDALSGHAASANSSVVTITHAAAGYATYAHEGSGTTFTFAVTTEGDTAADIGYTDGDIEVTLEQDLVDVTAHQKGTHVLSQIATGKQVELVVNFKETSVAQLKKLFRQAGGTLTPAGGGGTEVVGWGSIKDFEQTTTYAKKLNFHPVVLGSGDKSRDWTFFKTHAMIDSIALSGENVLSIPVTFKVYPDLTLNSRVQYFAFGDGSQTLT